jgi:hypothetical protein
MVASCGAGGAEQVPDNESRLAMTPSIRADPSALHLVELALAGDDDRTQLAADGMNVDQLRSAALYLARCYSGVLSDTLGLEPARWAVTRLREELERRADEREHVSASARNAGR